MKKLLTSFVLFGALAMTSCSVINNIIDPEKEYTLDNFKTLLAERKLSTAVPYSKVKLEISGVTASNEEKSETREYTYDGTKWVGESETDYVELVVMNYLGLVEAVQEMSKDYAKDAKFYARKDSYRMTYVSESSTAKIEFEWKYNEKGFMNEANLKGVDKEAIKSATENVKLTYTLA